MPFQPIEPGTLLSNSYRIEHLIRRGGMGATYLGTDLQTKQKVAIKELLNTFKTSSEQEVGVRNFLAEMGVLKALHHPQIPKILDHFVDKNRFFFVLEYVSGKDYTQKLEETRRTGLSENEVIRVGIQVCHVLDYLHHAPIPIVHRDIKPSNIMERSDDGRIMVLDFGISRAAHPGEGMMIGTVGYAPPEQYENRTDPRSDIYSLGVTLHELLTGLKPDSSDIEFPPPYEIRSDISKQLSDIVMMSLNYSPLDRFQEASHLATALQALSPETVSNSMNDPFEVASQEFSSYLHSLLLKIKSEYINECLSEVPKSLERAEFTLGTLVPCSLLITTDRRKKSIRFEVKEGMLSPKLLGEIFLLDHLSWNKADDILSQFVTSYEQNL